MRLPDLEYCGCNLPAAWGLLHSCCRHTDSPVPQGSAAAAWLGAKWSPQWNCMSIIITCFEYINLQGGLQEELLRQKAISNIHLPW